MNALRVALIAVAAAVPAGAHAPSLDPKEWTVPWERTTREIWFGTDAGTIGAVKVPAEIRKLTP